jgi:hypothetical protein
MYTVQYGGQGNGGALVRSIPLNVQELLLPSVQSYTIKAGPHQTFNMLGEL